MILDPVQQHIIQAFIHTQRKAHNMQEQQSSSESSDEDEELLLAASEWAESSTQNDQVEESNSNGVSDQQSKSTNKYTSKNDKKEISDTSSSRNNEDSAAASKDTISKSMHTNSTQQQQTYSLHMTKVPYTATQTDIRFAFGQKGCNITSIRLVYDRDQKTGERHFRGVAFVDLADEKSYNKALEFHNKPFLGKGLKVGVRPTVPKSQLSDIVRKTEEKVATLIARSKETAQKKREAGDIGDADDDKKERPKSNAAQDGKSNKHQDRGSVEDKKKHKKKKRKSPDASTSKDSAEATSSTTNKKPKGNDSNARKAKGNKGQNMKKESNKKNTKPEKNTDGSPIKLTKKQRAKKAAIIRMRKLKSRK